MAAEKFYFAWVDPETEFDPEVHNVMDEDVFSLSLTQEEGDFAALSMVVKNPRIGLLNTGRKVWAWLSFDPGTGTIQPMFLGRLVGIPDNIFDTLVTFKFTARPVDYAEQKQALFESLKVRPYWDPIFIAADSWNDPDTALEARSILWHIDPVTHVVTTSDVLVPEDGVIEFNEDAFFYDSMSLTLGQPPARSVTLTATVPWTVSGTGGIPLGGYIAARYTDFTGYLITSFTLQGLVSSWPKPGSKIGSGWEVINGELKDVSYSGAPMQTYESPNPLDDPQKLPAGSIAYPPKISGKLYGGVDGAGFDINAEIVYVPLGYGKPVLDIGWEANREYGQIISFVLKTDTQAIVTLSDEDDTILINLSGNNVTEDNDGEIPLPNNLARDFIHTDRGQEAVEHCILVARANLIMRSRCVQISFQTDFKTGLTAANLRKGALIHDDRIPGGQATGKIIGYELALDGESGAALATIKFACAVGKGGAPTAAVGDPVYVAAGYVAAGYQAYENTIVLTGTSDIGFTIPTYSAFDDLLDLSDIRAGNMVMELNFTNKEATQRAALNTIAGSDQAAVSSKLQLVPTTISLKLKPMEGGPYQQQCSVGVSDLKIPKQIDLEAASV